MNYDFLPNISKTKILDGINLSLAQQLYLKKLFAPEPVDDVLLLWEGRGIGQSFALAIASIEMMLNNNTPIITVSDHFGTFNANKCLFNKIGELVEKDKRLKFVCLSPIIPGKAIKVKIEKTKEFEI